MIASLMMYIRPELDSAHARYWALIRDALAARGIDAPIALDQDGDEFAVWNAPDLVLSQTCGMPYRTWLHDKVTLIGTPDFGVPGCPAGYYKSAIIVRSDDHRKALADFKDARFTYNQTFSQSGYAAPHALTKPLGFWFADRSQSYGHLNSARTVVEGKADIAALDAVSWRLIQQYEPFADKLRILEWTPPTPGLPYIAALDADQKAVFSSISTAIAALTDADRNTLGIKGLVAIPKDAYLEVANPPVGDK